MSIDTVNDLEPRVQYVAAAAQTDFDYPFPIFADADLLVYVDGVLKTLTTHYTVAGEGNDAGGTITFVTPMTGAEVVTILREIAVERLTDFQQNGPWQSSSYNDEQDRTYLILQELKSSIKRALRLPNTTEVDTDDLELPLANWASKYLTFDADGVPTPAVLSAEAMTQATVGGLLYPQTAAEITAGVTPTNYAYPAYTTPRYGAAGDATTDDAAAIQREIDSCIQAGAVLDLWGTSSTGYKINTALEITGKLKIRGHGYGKCGIIANGVNAFNITTGIDQVEMEGFRINSAIRHTTTPNTLKGINIQGTTASPCEYHKYRDLFIDGFETPIQANGVRASEFQNITTVFGKHGIIAEEQTVNNRVLSCLLTGSGGYGVKNGDGSASSEGWIISNSVLFGFARGVWGYGCNNSHVIDSIIDFFTEYGVLLQSGAALAATNWIIKGNYMAASGTASSGVRCLSSYASSNNRGNTISENGILVYSGSTLSYGILVDGTEEYYNRIVDNSLKATTYDCRITSGTTHLVDGNSFLGGGFSSTVRVHYGRNMGTVLTDPNVFMKRDPYTVVRKVVTYSASMTPDLAEANHFDITATNGTAFTVNLPTNYTNNEHFTITIRNTSGGALGAATWTAGYKMAAWTQPATGYARSITFAYNPATTYFEEVSRTAADVPN